jgi:hypothetical protein
VESLDDVIDAMIADRVIHRHRRKWLIAIAIVVLLALVILFTGGWKQKKGRTVDTLPAPVTVAAGRFEYGVTSARIIRIPKSSYDPAKARVEVSIDLKNIDAQQKKSISVPGSLLILVPGGGKDIIESNGATCRGKLGYVFVYGLPAETCTTKFDVPADFAADVIELGIKGEKYESDDSLLGATAKPYWHNEVPVAVVRVPATTTTETK